MEDYLEYKTFRIQEKITEEKVIELLDKSDDTHGIEKVKCAGQTVSIIYNPYAIGETFSDAEWDVAAMHMRVRAKLTEEEATKIAEFLKIAN